MTEEINKPKTVKTEKKERDGSKQEDISDFYSVNNLKNDGCLKTHVWFLQKLVEAGNVVDKEAAGNRGRTTDCHRKTSLFVTQSPNYTLTFL